jgi:hypothetical protein
VSPVKYELGFYIPEDDVLHSHRRENLKSYSERSLAMVYRTQNHWVSGVSPSSGIQNSRDRNVSESGSVSVFKWEKEIFTLLGALERASFRKVVFSVF